MIVAVQSNRFVTGEVIRDRRRVFKLDLSGRPPEPQGL